jgi:hypothetical protein
MPLHRDIHWIGRQWAVTGHGVQLIDQKLQGFFDIEVSKLWDDVLIEAMHAKDWLNTADFEKALGIARSRYQRPGGTQPARAATPPREVTPSPAIEPLAPPPPVVKSAPLEAPKQAIPEPVKPPPAAVVLQAPASATPPAPEPPPSEPPTLFRMRCEGRARFVRPWRVVARKI